MRNQEQPPTLEKSKILSSYFRSLTDEILKTVEVTSKKVMYKSHVKS